MSDLTFQFGDLKLRIAPRAVYLFPAEARQGEHATFFLEPQEGGRHHGFLTPHITRPKARERRERRDFLGRFRPSDLQAAVKDLQGELAQLWAGASRRVVLEQLDAEGWWVLGADDAVQAKVKELFFVDPMHFSFGSDYEAKCLELFDVLLERGVPPSELQPSEQLRWMVRLSDDAPFGHAMIGHYPNGMFGLPGWYLTKHVDFGDILFRSIFMRQASEKVIQALLKLGQFLGGEPAPELIELLEQRRRERGAPTRR